MGAIISRRGRHCSGSIRQILAAQSQGRQPRPALRHGAFRRDSRRARREVIAFSEEEKSVEPHFEFEDETQCALASAMDCLPHDQREVLVLKIWNELTFAEIANAVGISQNTAASRYRYALAGLKKSLQPQ